MSPFLLAIDGRTDDALFALTLAICIHLVVMFLGKIGGVVVKPMPLIEILFRPFFTRLVDKLNRENRTEFALIIRGIIVFAIMMICIYGVGFGLKYGLGMIGFAQMAGVVMLLLCLSPCLSIPLVLASSKEKPRKGVFLNVAESLNQNLVTSDVHGLRRNACKLLAVSLIEWCVAPLFFYLLYGLPTLCLYVSLSLFVRISGENSKTFQSFLGIIYKVMKGVAGIFSVFFVFSASIFSTGGRPYKTFHAYAGTYDLTLAALANAQNIILGGPYQDRYGQSVKHGWVGPKGATAKLERADVTRCAIMSAITVFILFVTLFAYVVFGV